MAATTTTSSVVGVRFSLLLIALYFALIPLALTLPFLVARRVGLAAGGQGGLTLDSFIAFVLVSQAVGAAVCVALLRRRLRDRGESWTAVGVRRCPFWRSTAYIAAWPFIVLVLILVAASIAVAAGLAPPADDQATAGEAPLRLFGGFWPAFLFMVVFAPVMEELLFRGMLFGALKRRYPLWAAVVVSTLAFAVAHINPAQIATGLVVGPYLALMYHRLGSVYPGMALHALWNATVLAVAVS